MTATRLLIAAAALMVLAGVGAGQTRTRRPFPDTTSRIAILTDQLPGGMTDAQVRFAATHYVGTQKLTRNLSRPLRAITPGFLVLHYRLAMWQSAPHVSYITDGDHWSNDFPFVTMHESWFWHNPAGRRVASNQDGKLLMNIADPGFRAYWKDSIAAQVEAGDYDGVFLDSASPALLQWEARTPPDRRLMETGVRFNRFPELGNRTWIQVWEEWIADIDRYLGARGIPLIPNVGALATSWDNADYSLTAGVFSEGFLDPGLSASDWKRAAEQTWQLARQGRIVILQNYLSSNDDVERRKYLLASYLLVKGRRTYLSYFGPGGLQWYPEWDLDLGPPVSTPATLDSLRWQGVYRRDFAHGTVLVNPEPQAVSVRLDPPLREVRISGGGPVGPDGAVAGRVDTAPVASLRLAPKSAAILRSF